MNHRHKMRYFMDDHCESCRERAPLSREQMNGENRRRRLALEWEIDRWGVPVLRPLMITNAMIIEQRQAIVRYDHTPSHLREGQR